jgi:hypothetical protein
MLCVDGREGLALWGMVGATRGVEFLLGKGCGGKGYSVLEWVGF